MKQHYPCQTWARRAFLFLLFLTLKTQAATSSILDDTSSITLHVVNQPIENIFKLIEKQTGLTFYYGRAILDGGQLASVSVDKAPLSEVMGVLLKGKNVSWRVKDKGVVLSKGGGAPEKVTTNVVGDTVPRIDVRGVVVDVAGKPVAGASVSLKGQQQGQGTNLNGEFSFNNIRANSMLLISSIAFTPQQVRISNRSFIKVVLDSMITEIKAVEVVSTGYQEIPKERATGSFVLLDNAAINRTVSTNILDRIVNITSSLKSERGVGSNSDISIRGYSTINANMKPLIVVDGFPYDEGYEIPGLVSYYTLLNNINPNDIESITILRDAAAASIWGARSGNGVIVIKTKKGNYNRRTAVQLTSSVNFIEKPDLKYLPIISSKDAVEFEKAQFRTGKFNEYDDIYPGFDYFPVVSPVTEILLAERRGAITKAEADEKLARLSNHDVRDDLTRYLLRVGVNQQYNLNVSGGSLRNSFYGSIGYDRNTTNTPGNDNSRLSLRFDNTFRPIDKLEINTYINYSQWHSYTNGINYTTYLADGNRSTAAPYIRLANENGNPLHVPTLTTLREPYIDSVSLPGLLDWHYRPLNDMKYLNNSNREYSTRFGGALKYNITSWLNAEFRGQYEKKLANSRNESSINTFETRNLINQFMYIDPAGKTIYPIPLGSILTLGNTDATSWNARGQLNANKGWQNHQINALLGYEVSEKKFTVDQDRKYGYNPETGISKSDIDYVNNFTRHPNGNYGPGKIPTPVFNWGGTNRFKSSFGNVGYTYNGKYTVTASGRVDQSNFLGAKHNQRYVPLYSAGASWNISDEGFYKVTWLPYLRLRATYGYNGNLNNLATALPTAKLNPPSGTYHSQPTLYLINPPNPGLTWEKTRIINIGVDFQAFKNRVNGLIEYYTKRGKNLIGQLLSDPTTGVGSYTGNYASMKGKGIDIILNTVNINRAISWRTTLNFSYNTDKVTDYTQSEPSTSYVSSPNLAIPGYPLQKFYSYSFAGLNPENGNPMGYVQGKAVDFSEVIESAQVEDLIYHGSASPRIFGSLINTLSYHDLSLTFNITYRFNYYFRRPSINYTHLAANWGGHSDYALRWQKPGDEHHTTVPSLPEFFDPNRDDFYSRSNILIERGDHIRFQDISLGYDLLKSKIKRLPFSRGSIYLNANNLGIIWRRNKLGLDPEVPAGALPQSRSIAARLIIDF